MESRAEHEEEDVCAYLHCELGPDGGPARLVQASAGRRRHYCCDQHRVAANQEGARRGRVALLPTPRDRHISFGDDVLSAYRGFRASLEQLPALAERLTKELASAAELRAAQALVDGANRDFEARDQSRILELRAEIAARIAAVDRAEAAEEEAERACEDARHANETQAQAEARLAKARETLEADKQAQEQRFEAEREALQHELNAAVAAAQARAAEAQVGRDQALERALRAEGALAELQVRLDSELGKHQALAARQQQEFDRRVQDEHDRAEQRLREVREVLQTRIADGERLTAERAATTQHLQRELERVVAEAARERTYLGKLAQDERERWEARLSELRASYEAQLTAARQLAEFANAKPTPMRK